MTERDGKGPGLVEYERRPKRYSLASAIDAALWVGPIIAVLALVTGGFTQGWPKLEMRAFESSDQQPQVHAFVSGDRQLPRTLGIDPHVVQSQTATCHDLAEFETFFTDELRNIERVQNGSGFGVRIAGLAPLRLDPAPAELIERLLGPPSCRLGEPVWQAGMQGFSVVLYGPRTHPLPDGRSVFLAAAYIFLDGAGHRNGSYAAAILDANGEPIAPLQLLPAFGTRAWVGALFVPTSQPEGAFHVWQAGGGRFIGEATIGLAVLDFGGNAPRPLGAFAADRTPHAIREECSRFTLAAAEYLPNGKVRVRWKLERDGGPTFMHAVFSMVPGLDDSPRSRRGPRYALTEGRPPPCGEDYDEWGPMLGAALSVKRG